MSLFEGGLYSILQIALTDNKAIAKISLNPEHNIFNGHFPGQPVLPGVCQVQFIREITERLMNKQLYMNEVSQIKFLKIIDPNIIRELIITIDYTFSDTFISFIASITDGKDVCLKMKGRFVELNNQSV